MTDLLTAIKEVEQLVRKKHQAGRHSQADHTPKKYGKGGGAVDFDTVEDNLRETVMGSRGQQRQVKAGRKTVAKWEPGIMGDSKFWAKGNRLDAVRKTLEDSGLEYTGDDDRYVTHTRHNYASPDGSVTASVGYAEHNDRTSVQLLDQSLVGKRQALAFAGAYTDKPKRSITS